MTDNLNRKVDLLTVDVLTQEVVNKMEGKKPFTKLAHIEKVPYGGGVIKVPVIDYAGDAEVLGEGEKRTGSKLKRKYDILNTSKLEKSFDITQEGVLSGSVENIVEKGLTSIASSIEGGQEAMLVAAAKGAKAAQTITADSYDNAILRARAKFGENLNDAPLYVFMNSVTEAKFQELKRNPDSAGLLKTFNGAIPMISDRVEDDVFYLVVEGALGLYVAADTDVFKAWDKDTYSWVIGGTKHLACHIRYPKNLVKAVIQLPEVE